MQTGEHQTKQNTVQGRSIENCCIITGTQAHSQTAGLKLVPYLLTIRLRRPLLVGPLTQRMSRSQLTLKAVLCLARQEYTYTSDPVLIIVLQMSCCCLIQGQTSSTELQEAGTPNSATPRTGMHSHCFANMCDAHRLVATLLLTGGNSSQICS